MILNNAAKLLPLEMNGTSSATLIFIILILKFDNQVKQFPTHVGTYCWPNVTSLLWVTHTLKSLYKLSQQVCITHLV